EAVGAHARVVVVERVDRASLAPIFEELRRSGRPLRGVIAAAKERSPYIATLGTLEHEPLADAFAQTATVAWTLHELTRGTPLDFFVVYATVASLFAGAGQGSS